MVEEDDERTNGGEKRKIIRKTVKRGRRGEENGTGG